MLAVRDHLLNLKNFKLLVHDQEKSGQGSIGRGAYRLNDTA